MIEFPYKSSRIRILDEPTYTLGSADNVRNYEYESRLDSGEYSPSSAHGIALIADDEIVASHLVAASGGATCVHDSSAVVVGDRCILAVGPYFVAFRLPSLEIEWSTEVDWATAFGVHLSTAGEYLLSHGETTICRLNFDGQIEWQEGGADIFTEGFSVEETCVRAVDFENREYRFDLTSGKPMAS